MAAELFMLLKRIVPMDVIPEEIQRKIQGKYTLCLQNLLLIWIVVLYCIIVVLFYSLLTTALVAAAFELLYSVICSLLSA